MNTDNIFGKCSWMTFSKSWHQFKENTLRGPGTGPALIPSVWCHAHQSLATVWRVWGLADWTQASRNPREPATHTNRCGLTYGAPCASSLLFCAAVLTLQSKETSPAGNPDVVTVRGQGRAVWHRVTSMSFGIRRKLTFLALPLGPPHAHLSTWKHPSWWWLSYHMLPHPVPLPQS